MVNHWAINGRFLTQPLSGVQRYGHEIIRALDQAISEGHPLARDLEVELLVPASVKDPPRLRSIATRIVGRRSGQAWEQLELPFALRGGLLSLGNTGPLAAAKHVVCIHDVNTRTFPSSYSWKFRLLYRALLPAVGRAAKRVATVSNFSAQQLVRYGIAPAGKIDVVPDGHEHAARWVPAHSPSTRKAASANTIVVIGTPAPHKNLKVLLALADKLGDAGLRIAVVGSVDPAVYSFGLLRIDSEQILWLGRLSDGELAALLQDCLCLAFPSLAEGFGLPALEAMVHKCPVVVSDRTSLPEICGGAALYASPTDPGAWLDCFLQLRQNDHLRQELITQGQVRLQKYSWRRSAELYLQTMAKL